MVRKKKSKKLAGVGLRGVKIEATYKPQQLPEHQDNPLIEALPLPFSQQRASDAVANFIRFDPAVRQLEAHLRLQAMWRLRSLVVPMTLLIQKFLEIDNMIRSGLVGRNPYVDGEIVIEPYDEPEPPETTESAPMHDYLSRSELKTADSRTEEEKIKHHRQRMLDLAMVRGTVLLAPSGMGKTTLFRSILLNYPQVIEHGEYRGLDFPFQQIVWMMVECPHNGSPTQLILNIMREINALIGTNYDTKSKRSLDQAISDLEEVNRGLRIGILVIDELNRLQRAKGKTKEDLLEFLVKFANSVYIPLVFSGTNQARPLLEEGLQQMRRVSANGAIEWSLPKRDPKTGELPKDLDNLLKTLFRRQYVRNPVALDDEFRTVLFESTAGITDLIVTLLILAQKRLIINAKSAEEEILTPALIQQTAAEEFQQLMPVMTALIEGKTNLLVKYEDLRALLDERIEAQFKRDMAEKGASERGEQDILQAILNTIQAAHPDDDVRDTDASEASAPIEPETPINGVVADQPSNRPSKTRKRGQKQSKTSFEPDDLRYNGKGENEDPQALHDSMQVRGYIGQASDYVRPTRESE